MSKKERIFNRYVSELNKLIEMGLYNCDRETYLCPICLQKFSLKQLDNLTLEDNPPKSVGGKANILTCKKCNNDCGGKFDWALKEVLKGLSPIRVGDIVKSVNGITSSVIGIEGNRIQLKTSEKNNNPKDLEKNICDAKKFYKKEKKHSNKEIRKLALLKAAYLIAFEKIGYRLILSRPYDEIRKAIKEADITFFKDKNFISAEVSKNKSLDKLKEERSVIILFISKVKKCLFVNFQIKYEETERFITAFLPLPEGEFVCLDYINNNKDKLSGSSDLKNLWTTTQADTPTNRADTENHQADTRTYQENKHPHMADIETYQVKNKNYL